MPELKITKKTLQQILDSTLASLIVVDQEGKIVHINSPAEQTFGYKKRNLIGHPIETLVPAPARKRHMHYRKTYLAHPEPRYMGKGRELNAVRKDGSMFPAEIGLNPLTIAEGLFVICTIIDITERKKGEEELLRLQEHLKTEKRKLEQVLSIDQRISSILELNHLVDFVIEKATKILDVEKCSLMLLDTESQELLIRGAVGLNNEVIKTARIKLGEQIAGLVAKEGRPLLVKDIERDEAVSRKNKSAYKFKSFLSVPIKLHNKLIGVVNVADKKSKQHTEFTEDDLKILSMIIRQAAIAIENANYCRKLEYLTITDPLTEIYNHRHFISGLDQEIHRAKRYGGHLCLMMIDIDDFKAYNDTHGHLQGDHLLKEVSRLLKEHCRIVDIICRYAGDEFVVILPETDLSQAQMVAGRLKKALAGLRLKCSVTACIGLAVFTQASDRRDLILKADQALYRAKKEGKGELCW